MDIPQAIDKLGIGSDLKLKFKSLKGTRHIIQYEHPEYVFTLSKTFKPKIKTFGVTNRCADGKFILFLDYDKIYKSIIYKNLDNLMKRFPSYFDNFYIAGTDKEELQANGDVKGSYHVINFVKHKKKDIEEFLDYCDIDPYFIKMPTKTAHKCNVLRFSEKVFTLKEKIIKERPKFLEIYPKSTYFSNRPCSLAHYMFFANEWDNYKEYMNAECYHEFDKLGKIELHKYSTPKMVD